MKLALGLLASLALETALAAPFPATGSSILTDPSKGVFFHGFGFRLNALEPSWTPVPSAGESVFDSVRFEPKSEGPTDATVSIRMDRIPEKSSLESYAKKWMREYPTYGFEVLGTKNLNLGGGRALLVDLLQKSKGRQLRQVILQNKDKVAVLTCLDHRDKFDETLQTCNRLIRGFEWAEPARAAADEARPMSKPSTPVIR